MPRREISTTIPEGYPELLTVAKERVRRAHISAARRVNSDLVRMYLELGQLILDRQADEGWGTRVIHHLAKDLSDAFPGQRGFSEHNLRYCRTSARLSPAPSGQQHAAQLPWGHVMVLTDKVEPEDLRLWYAAQAVEHGWSRSTTSTPSCTPASTAHPRPRRSRSPPSTPSSCATWSRIPTAWTSSSSTPATQSASSRTPWPTG